MVSKKLLAKHGTTILIGLVVLTVVLYILHQPGASPITRGVAAAKGWLEGFNGGSTTGTFSTADNSCPPGFSFFNDATGASFCCKGTVDVFAHKCMSDGAGDLCAMMPNVADPRKAHKGKKLPTCAALKRDLLSAANANFCPSTLPNYATSNKCCKSPAVGADCSAGDLADKANYCVAGGAATAGEQSCYNLKLMDMATCPAGMSKFQLSATGVTEWNTRYGAANTANLMVPACNQLGGGTCMPNNVLEKLRREKNLFGDKTLASWKYACGAYKRKYIDGEGTLTLDESL
jgi:hypothetical protein